MSIDYTLNISTGRKPSEFLEFLMTSCGFVELSEKVAQRNEVIASVYSPSNTGPLDSLGNTIFQQAYGFKPSVAICFQPDKFDKNFTFKVKYASILQSVITLLSYFSGDAVLQSPSNETILWRLNGQLEIDTKWYEGISLEGLSPNNFTSLPSPLG
jgi:hypothetical protein